MKRKKRETQIELVQDWFSNFTKTVITEKEARAFLGKLPRALEELQMVNKKKTPLISAAEQKNIEKRIEKRREALRKAYPEVHGKAVDYITHTVTDGTLYFGVYFKNGTSFSIRYSCQMFPVGIDLSDWKSGDYNIIREYMKPMPH